VAANSGALLFVEPAASLQLGTLGRVRASDLTSDGLWSDTFAIRADLTPGNSGTTITTVTTLPAGLGTNTNGIAISDCLVRLRRAFNSGMCTVAVGNASGGTQYLAQQTITGSTAAGSVWGLQSGELGTSFTTANLFNAVVNGATDVVVTVLASGIAGSTAPLLTLHMHGVVL